MMETITPNIFVKDIRATISFYRKLGFEVIASVPDPDNPDWVMMTCGNVNFMFQTYENLGDDLHMISRQKGGSLLLYIQIKNIRNFYLKVREDVKIVKEPETTFYGATEFSVEDINGYILTFAEDEEVEKT